MSTPTPALLVPSNVNPIDSPSKTPRRIPHPIADPNADLGPAVGQFRSLNDCSIWSDVAIFSVQHRSYQAPDHTSLIPHHPSHPLLVAQPDPTRKPNSHLKAKLPPVKNPAVIAFHGSSFCLYPFTAQSKDENNPPQTPKFPPKTGARALMADTEPIRRSPRGELRAPLIPCHIPPPIAPMANAPPKSLRMTYGLSLSAVLGVSEWELAMDHESGRRATWWIGVIGGCVLVGLILTEKSSIQCRI
jgi:hypothetical protein